MNPENLVSLGPWLGPARRLAAVLFAGSLALGCKKEAPPVEASAPAIAAASAAPALPPVPAGSVRVVVTEDGFQPTRVELKKDEKLLFRRTTDSTCAKAVVFPELHIEKDLPLNSDVAIELPPTAKGELGFQCGMGMYKSKLVVN